MGVYQRYEYLEERLWRLGVATSSPVRVRTATRILYLYVKDVDAVVAQAVAAGAKLVHPVKDQFYGDRSGGLDDPFGHLWHIATHKEDVPPKELRKRAEAVMGGQGPE